MRKKGKRRAPLIDLAGRLHSGLQLLVARVQRRELANELVRLSFLDVAAPKHSAAILLQRGDERRLRPRPQADGRDLAGAELQLVCRPWADLGGDAPVARLPHRRPDGANQRGNFVLTVQLAKHEEPGVRRFLEQEGASVRRQLVLPLQQRRHGVGHLGIGRSHGERQQRQCDESRHGVSPFDGRPRLEVPGRQLRSSLISASRLT